MKIVEMNSIYTFEDTVSRVKAALPDIGFGILFELPFHDVLYQKGFPISTRAVLLEICQPSLAQGVLDGDIGFAYYLPCKVIIRQDDTGVYAGFLSVREAMVDKGGESVEQTAMQVEVAITKLINSATAAQ